MRKGLVIIPSIRELKYWKEYEQNASRHEYSLKNIDVLVIDENPINRKVNSKILENVNHWFYGFDERIAWLNDRNLPIDIIPLRCHAETSFGLLWAYKKDYDYIIFMDDDTAPTSDDYFRGHINQLFDHREKQFNYCANKWCNLIGGNRFPRGFPYSERSPERPIIWQENIYVNAVMNQGLWCNQLDLNAADILPNVNGLTTPAAYANIYPNAIINPNTYITICSMNLSFKPEIIPAFYQLPMNSQGIDRFDDIWSGVFIKKIADHLGQYISNGAPLCDHRKVPRSTFKDLKAEAYGLEINEELWKIVDNIRLEGTDWKECYRELANDLSMEKHEYFTFLGESMEDWISVIEKL